MKTSQPSRADGSRTSMEARMSGAVMILHRFVPKKSVTFRPFVA